GSKSACCRSWPGRRYADWHSACSFRSKNLSAGAPLPHNTHGTGGTGSMEASHQLILAGAALVAFSILLGQLSSRLGAPLLLVFLAIGMLAGEDGPGGIQFSDYNSAFIIGSLALAVILFDGGLRTSRETLRLALGPAISLASVGVAITAFIVGAVAALLFDFSWA